MPPPAPKPKSAGGIGGRLTRKVGPLPVWAWAAAILAAYLLYSRLSSGGPPAASEPPAPAPSDGTGNDAGPGILPSVGGSSGSFGDPGQSNDLLAQLYGVNAASIDSLTSALLTKQSIEAANPNEGGPPGASSQATAMAPTPAPVAASKASPPGTSQPQAGVLYWDGKAFATKTAFNAWLKARGFNAQKYLANKPQAKAIYSALPA